MSSAYRLICLNHDPAIVIPEPEWSSPAEAMHAARHRDSNETLAVHAACDLVVGRYSYPLIEVGCPVQPPAADHRIAYHGADGHWVDARWMRLLITAHRTGDPAAAAATREAGVCWTAERAERLRLELGLEG